MKLFYKEENYPFFYSSTSGKLRGVLLELWQTVASLRGEELVIEKIPSSDVSDECLLVDAFSYVSPRTISPEQTHTYHYSTWVFVERTEEKFDIIPSVVFYFVFTADVLFWIFLAHVIRVLLEKGIGWVRARGRKKIVPAGIESLIGYVNLARLTCILFSFCILRLTWQGCFNGNTLIAIEKQGTLFSLLLTQFHSGTRKLVIEDGVDYFDDGEGKTLFGGVANFVYGNSVEERLRTTCADFSRVGFFYETDYLLYRGNAALQAQCNLARINLLPGESTPVPWLTQNMREGKAVFYQFHRNESRKNREMIDFALLTVYRIDNLDGTLMMRHLDVREFLTVVNFLLSRYSITDSSPITLEQVALPLSILLLGAALGILLLFFENVLFYSRIICCSRD
ncbi:hypothetical protein PENTCL1PPCAC_16787 [Pristionchus entomophagus]|uniref:Ion channel n=1 Tax=Pristionchus entomophagus TaxID=358040 RepID=A0AAV5TK78_9BILA|nr:hypothetical protein PENTCL1PPCAC_16787 [Pristionchus entomophagus]